MWRARQCLRRKWEKITWTEIGIKHVRWIQREWRSRSCRCSMSMFRSSVCVRVWILQRACMHVRVLCGSYHSLCPYTYMYAHETTTKLSLWVSGFNPNKATHAYTHTHTHTRTHTYTPYRWTALLSRLLSIVVLKWQSCHFLAQRSSLLMRLCACWGFVCDLNVCAPQYICTCIIGRLLATIHDDDNHFFYDF